MSKIANKQVRGLPFKGFVNTATLAPGAFIEITGTATVRLIDVLLKRTSGNFNGKFSSDFGLNFSAGEWSSTAIRVYNETAATTFAIGDIKIIYAEAQ